MGARAIRGMLSNFLKASGKGPPGLEPGDDRLLLELDGEPRVFSIVARGSVAMKGAGKQAAWPRIELAEDGGGRRMALEFHREGLILLDLSPLTLGEFSIAGSPVCMDTLARVMSSSSGGASPSLEAAGRIFSPRYGVALEMERSERFRFLFESGNDLVAVEVFRDRPDPIVAHEGRFLPREAFVQAWKDGVSRSRR